MHVVGVAGDDDCVSTEGEGGVFFLGGGGEDGGVGTEGVGELDAHVAEATEADDADFFACEIAPATHGGVGGDAGAEQGGDAREAQISGDAEDEVFIDHDAAGVAAVGDGGGAVFVGGIVGEGGVRAELLEIGLALGTGLIGVHEAADADDVAEFVFFH